MSFTSPLRLLLLVMGLLAMAQVSNADCTGPAGIAGSIAYSSNYNTPAWCDGTNWNTFGGTGGAGTADNLGNHTATQNLNLSGFSVTNGLNASFTALGSFGSLLDNGGLTVTGAASITTVSTSLIQIGNTGQACSSTISGSMRYSTTSSTMEYCNSSAWVSMGPSSTLPVAFQVNKNGTDQTVAAGTPTKLTWSTEEFDTNNNFAANRFTANVPGYYLITLAAQCTTVSGNGGCEAFIYKNGGVVKAGLGRVSSQNMTAMATTILPLAVGDYVEGYVYDNGTNIDGAASSTWMSGVLLSPQGGGSGGTANPAGTTNDIQFNSGGLLAADTGNFTYTSSTLKTPSLLTGGITATGAASLTTVSTSLIQIGNTGASCTGAISGSMRYSTTSGTMEYCNSTAWVSMGPSATVVPSFYATVNNSLSVSNTVAVKLSTLGSVSFDTNNNFSNSRFTVSVPGTYIFTAAARIPGAASGNAWIYIEKNGTQIAINQIPITAGTTSIYIATLDRASVGDYYEVYVQQNSTGTLTIPNSATVTYFAGSLITMSGGAAGGGIANPAGTTNDVQFNSGGLLAADTGNFTYASSTLSAPSISTTVASLASGTVISVKGGSGNSISSGTASVSTSSAGVVTTYAGGAARMYSDGAGTRIYSPLVVSATDSTPSSTIAIFSAGNGRALTLLQPDPASGGSPFIFQTPNAFEFMVDSIPGIIIDEQGNVGIGTSASIPNPGVSLLPTGVVKIGNASSTASGWWFVNFLHGGTSIGSIAQNGTTAVLYNTTSDRRVKGNITSTTLGLDTLMKLPVHEFQFKNDPSHTTVNGFIAQELERFYPDAVTTNGDDGKTALKPGATPWSVDYGRITPLIVKAVQDLNEKAEAANKNTATQLKAANDNIIQLRNEIDQLKSELHELKQANKK